MHWLIGIDEAGYGPNLGPFVMSAVACGVPDDCAERDLWELLSEVARRKRDADGGQILVDDSKVVYGASTGLQALETSVLATLPVERSTPWTLSEQLATVASDSVDFIQKERWFQGTTELPLDADQEKVTSAGEQFAQESRQQGIVWKMAQSVVVCAPQFNALVEKWDSKGGVLAHCLIQLLQQLQLDCTDGALSVFVDKHGGRNAYGVMLQDAFTNGLVLAQQESAARSHYRVMGAEPEIRITFMPRADAAHFCVALASMVSKYLREVLMHEFNAYWQKHVEGLKPTAGYPLDAARFMGQIRPVLAKLEMQETEIWRTR